jgi:hypothetical protein
MTDQATLIRRLRRLIDDAGHGYSQSAPGFSDNLTAVGVTDPSMDIIIDQEDAVTVLLSPLLSLTTGPAIARALQDAVRAADPALPDAVTEGFSNFSVRFHRQEGYVLQSGSMGGHSRVTILPASDGDDISYFLKLGLANGGFETEQQPDFSDEELGDMLDEALAYQNESGTQSSWTFFTLPTEYETIVTYRAWSSLIDVMLGRSASYFPQKVASEETSANVIFDNYMKLAKWLKDRIEELENTLGSGIIPVSTTRWDPLTGKYVGDNAYMWPENTPRINSVLVDETTIGVILEFEPCLSLDIKCAFVAHKSAPGVWDQTVLTEEDFSDPGFENEVGLSQNATLDRTIKNMRNNMVRISGFTPGQTYYFAIQLVDQNGVRYF